MENLAWMRPAQCLWAATLIFQYDGCSRYNSRTSLALMCTGGSQPFGGASCNWISITPLVLGAKLAITSRTAAGQTFTPHTINRSSVWVQGVRVLDISAARLKSRENPPKLGLTIDSQKDLRYGASA